MPLRSHSTPTRKRAARCVVALLALSTATGCSTIEKKLAEDQARRAAEAKEEVRAPRIDIQWRASINPARSWDYKVREYAEPVYLRRSDHVVVGAANGEVARLDAGDGSVRWRTQLERAIHGTPTVTDDAVFVGTLEGTIHALDIDNGEILWQGRVLDAIESEMTHALDRLFFVDASETLHAVDASTGKILWRYKRETPEYFLIKGSGAPIVVGDVVYVGFSDGALAAVQLDTGELLWDTDLSGGAREFIDVDLPPIADGEKLYAASYAGGVYGITREDGTVKWRVPLDSVSDLQLRDDTLYAASAQGRVVAIGADTGTPKWSLRIEGATPVRVAPIRDYLFVSLSSGPMTVLDRHTGRGLVQWHPSTGFNTRVVVGRNRAFAFSNGGYLYSFALAF